MNQPIEQRVIQRLQDILWVIFVPIFFLLGITIFSIQYAFLLLIPNILEGKPLTWDLFLRSVDIAGGTLIVVAVVYILALLTAFIITKTLMVQWQEVTDELDKNTKFSKSIIWPAIIFIFIISFIVNCVVFMPLIFGLAFDSKNLIDSFVLDTSLSQQHILASIAYRRIGSFFHQYGISKLQSDILIVLSYIGGFEACIGIYMFLFGKKEKGNSEKF